MRAAPECPAGCLTDGHHDAVGKEPREDPPPENFEIVEPELRIPAILRRPPVTRLRRPSSAHHRLAEGVHDQRATSLSLVAG